MFMMNYMKLTSVFQGNIYTTIAACGVDFCRRVRLVLITGSNRVTGRLSGISGTGHYTFMP
jgi:hypothetical protein